MYAIGIDIGTTTICGIRLNLDSGAVEETKTRDNSSFLSATHTWERLQDPNIILHTAKALLSELVCPGTAAIGISSQMHGILYLDKNGDPVSPLYTWQDGRGDLPYQGTTYAKALRSATGFGNVTDFVLAQTHALPENAAVFCSIGDFLAMQLTGRKMPLTHLSFAASFGLFDLNRSCFLYPNSRQPALTDEPAVLGTWNGIPVCAALGDNQASFLGSVSDPDGALINIGTGSQISFLSDSTECPDTMEARPYAGGKFLWAASALCGGRAYALLKQFFEQCIEMAGLKPPALYPIMERALQTLPIRRTLRFHNQFCGTRQNPALRGKIENLSPETFTPQDFLIGILYGIADELFALSGGLPDRCRTLVASGNGIRLNPALQKIMEQVFGMFPIFPVHREEAAYGAALFASVGSGVFPNLAQAQSLIAYES